MKDKIRNSQVTALRKQRDVLVINKTVFAIGLNYWQNIIKNKVKSESGKLSTTDMVIRTPLLQTPSLPKLGVVESAPSLQKYPGEQGLKR